VTSLSTSAAATDNPSTTRRHDGDTSNIRLLVVDDEEAFLRTVARIFKQHGIVAETVSSGYAALDLLDQRAFDVVLVDVKMPEMSGPEFLQRVKAAGYPVEVVLMTGFADISTAVSAMKAGARSFLTKPFVSNDAVVTEVMNAAQIRRLTTDVERLKREISAQAQTGRVVGTCAAIRDVYRRVEGVATTNSTVLVLGESGTGKELVARAIHDRSRRAGRPIVTVNCAAMPKELVESELFGHTRGAFTTAVNARAGLFEAANGGTLFLDEIGDLPMSVQVKLLRVLQSGEVKPVGSDTVKTVDVRVVAATNVDLKAAIAAGTFRQDLYYRLNVITLKLPPLRERGDDILLLAHEFLQKHAEASGRSAMRLSNEAALALARYEWPGNVRELEHAIEHAVVLSPSDVIPPSALPAEVLARWEGVAQPASSSSSPSSDALARSVEGPRVALAVDEAAGAGESGTLRDLVTRLGIASMTYPEAKKRFLAEFNDAYVNALVAAADGNVSEAARRSGLDRSNFRRLARATSTARMPVAKATPELTDAERDEDVG